MYALKILRRTKYYSGVFEREISEANGVTTEREINFIFAPDGLAAIYEKKNGTGNMYYVSTDNLGSINIIADAQGNIVNDLSYDAWGRRRNPYTWEQLTVAQTKALQPTLITDRGYTLHEHMDAFGLINMNGRAYDPLVGQFLSPDPFVQSATSTQSYNRYSYCWNNPLKYVDPSGYVMIDIDGLQFNSNSNFLTNNIVGHNMSNMTSLSTSSGFNLSWGDVVRLKNFGYESTYRHGKSGYWVNNNYWDSGPNWTGTKTVLPDVILKELRMRALNVTSTFVESEKLTAALEYIQYGPFSSRVLAQAWENNEGNFWRDHNKIPHNPQQGLNVNTSLSDALPDMMCITVSSNFIFGSGAGLDYNFGYVKGEGFFNNTSVRGGLGLDVSFGFSYTWGNYHGKKNPSADLLTGTFFYSEGGVFIFNGGYWADIDDDNNIGDQWSGGSFGLTFSPLPANWFVSGQTGFGTTSDPKYF